MYSYDIYDVLKKHKVEVTPYVKGLVLGGESCMWTEQVTYVSIKNLTKY